VIVFTALFCLVEFVLLYRLLVLCFTINSDIFASLLLLHYSVLLIAPRNCRRF